MKNRILFVLIMGILQVSFAQKNEFDGVNFDDEVQSMNRFGFSLFEEINRLPSDRNVIFSPFSLSVIMSMIENGAEGSTSVEIARTVHLNEDREERNEQYQAMFKYLAEDTLENGVFEWANKVFLDREVSSNEEFNETLDEYYYSSLEKIDFSTESVVQDRVEEWMRERLHHEIEFSMKQTDITQNIEMLLANTVYLDGEWEYAFDQNVIKDTFITSRFNELTVPFAKGVNYPVGLKMNPEYPNDSILVFDFKGNLQLEVLIPSSTDTLSSVIEKVNADYYSSFEMQEKINLDTVYMPLMNIEQMSYLKPLFIEMGMPSAFSAEANYSEIANGLMLDEIVHDSNLITGTKGRRPTNKNISDAKVSSIEPYHVVKIDRPYVFFVRGKRSDIILLMGVVNRF